MTPVRLVPLMRTGQVTPHNQAVGTPAQRQDALDQLTAAFRELSLPIVIGAVVIGLATGFGSTVGSAIGTIVADRLVQRRRNERRRD